MSVDNTDDKCVLIISPVETPRPSSQPDVANSSYSRYTPITASIPTLSPSAPLSDALKSSSKSHKNI